jgi:ketosteroid isomerase-like protein
MPFAVFYACGLFSTVVSAQSPGKSDSATVVETVERYHAALESGDSATALALLAPDASILESGGIETRSEYRSHHLSGDIAFARAVKSRRNPIAVTLSGNTAWATSTSTVVGSFKGKAINSAGAETMILTKEGEGWRIRSIHWSSRTRRPPAS